MVKFEQHNQVTKFNSKIEVVKLMHQIFSYVFSVVSIGNFSFNHGCFIPNQRNSQSSAVSIYTK